MSNQNLGALLMPRSSFVRKGAWLCLRLLARLTCYARLKWFPDYGRPFPLRGAWGWRPGCEALWYIGPTGMSIMMFAEVPNLLPPWQFWALTGEEAQRWLDEELLRHWEGQGKNLSAFWLHPAVYRVIQHCEISYQPIDPRVGP